MPPGDDDELLIEVAPAYLRRLAGWPNDTEALRDRVRDEPVSPPG